MTTIPAPNAPQPIRGGRISKRLRRAIDLIATGRVSTRKAAAEQAGITPEHLSRMLSRPEIRVVLRTKAEQNLSDATMKASALVAELLDTGGSEHVKAKLALRLLESDRLIAPAGGPSHQVNVNGDLYQPGYQILIHRKEHQGVPTTLEPVGDSGVMFRAVPTIDQPPEPGGEE